jgi:hypothetical protein
VLSLDPLIRRLNAATEGQRPEIAERRNGQLQRVSKMFDAGTDPNSRPLARHTLPCDAFHDFWLSAARQTWVAQPLQQSRRVAGGIKNAHSDGVSSVA